MSEIFTKIGGFVASGDAMVYADSATMTGDGTVASPFGVNKMDMFVQAPLFTGTSGEGDNTSAYIGCSGYNETVLFSGDVSPNGQTVVAQLSEPISAFDEYEVHCSFESMYPYTVCKFNTPASWEYQPNTTIYFGGICQAVSWKPTENDAILHAYMCLGFGSNLTDLYLISGTNVDIGQGNNATAHRTTTYGAGLYHVYKVVGINRKA